MLGKKTVQQTSAEAYWQFVPHWEGDGAPCAQQATEQTQDERRVSTRLNTPNDFADALRKRWQWQGQQEEQLKPFALALIHWVALKNVHPQLPSQKSNQVFT